MDSIKDRIIRSIAQRGVIGTIPMCWWSLRSMFTPADREMERQRIELDAEFDRQYGVDTGGTVRPRATAVVGDNWAHGISYEAVDPAEFTETLSRVSIPHSEFTFIDFGSGKGRALLLAARLPFRRIIGVEYCAALNEVARRNLLQTPGPARRWERIDILECDAAAFSIPNDPLVLFFFNPFGEHVMAQVARNVAESYRLCPRRIVVIYFTPYFAHLWEQTGFLERKQETPAVFDTTAGDKANGRLGGQRTAVIPVSSIKSASISAH